MNWRWLPFWIGLCLAGCTGSSKETVLRVSTWGGVAYEGPFDAQLRAILAQFEQDHPGVRVRIEGYPGADRRHRSARDELVAAIASLDREEAG